ncbi:MAG: Gfo/Idh/MocA family oxidoreductase [bacterium]|nr:Gfo/Idh/MocA family oxidoreductase [bacterium]
MSAEPTPKHSDTTLRCACIGAGYFSHFHYDAWSRIDAVRVVACCDVDRSKAQAVAEQYAIARTFSDYRQMLDEVEVDFVDIITRPETHADIVAEVAQRGLPMICQKPLANSLEECEHLVAVAAEHGVPFMIHENFRFQPWYREIKRLFNQGVVGEKLHTISFRNRAGDGHGPQAYLARQPYFQSMPRFLVFEAGIHTVDTFRFLAGEVSRVWCQLRRLNPVIAGEDAGIAVFEFEQGGLGLYDANRFNESTAEDPRYTFGELLFEADGGTLRLYPDGRLTIQPLGQPERDHSYQHTRQGFAGDCVRETQQHFVDCLLSKSEFETSGRNYLQSIVVQEAMYRSAVSGCWEKP